MDRLAIARKALENAELRAGLRVVRAQAPQSSTPGGEVSSDAFSVPPHLAGALPHGVIRRGVIGVWGSPFLLTLLASVLSGQEAWVAFLGTPDVGWACAERLGMDMRRVVAVPRVEAQGARVVSAAIDGFDAVILGDISLDARERRVLQRRAISKGSLLLAMEWPQASLDIDCQLVGVRGLGQGGHITAVDYRIATRWGWSDVRYERAGWGPAVSVPAAGLQEARVVSAEGTRSANRGLSIVGGRSS